MFDFYSELAKGGWVMIPIGLVSVLSLGLFLERLFTLRRSRVYPLDFVERVRALIRANKISEALVLCQRNASSMAMVLSVGLIRADQPRDQIKEAVEERGRIEAGRLDRFIEGLGTIAAIAPLLGLLGTVLGMIDVFKEVDATTQAGGMGVNPGALASGIWKALITTAAGLAVAIPTFVGYKYLTTRINRLILDMEEGATELVELLNGEPPAASAPPVATRRAGEGGAVAPGGDVDAAGSDGEAPGGDEEAPHDKDEAPAETDDDEPSSEGKAR
jgi:biopolymer transport protein ExbB